MNVNDSIIGSCRRLDRQSLVETVPPQAGSGETVRILLDSICATFNFVKKILHELFAIINFNPKCGV